jgi:hypothetical protein
MTLEHALLQTIGYGHVRDAAIEGEHAPMGTEPVAALHILCRPGKQQLTEAKTCNKDVGFADLARLQVDPVDGVTGVVDFYALARLKFSRRDRRFPVLRKLAVKLLPEI